MELEHTALKLISSCQMSVG